MGKRNQNIQQKLKNLELKVKQKVQTRIRPGHVQFEHVHNIACVLTGPGPTNKTQPNTETHQTCHQQKGNKGALKPYIEIHLTSKKEVRTFQSQTQKHIKPVTSKKEIKTT